MTERKENKFLLLFVAVDVLNMKGDVSKFFCSLVQNATSAMYYRKYYWNSKCYFSSSGTTKKQPPDSYQLVNSYGLHTQLPQKEYIRSLYIAWHLPF
jgi:hypothetical protein